MVISGTVSATPVPCSRPPGSQWTAPGALCWAVCVQAHCVALLKQFALTLQPLPQTCKPSSRSMEREVTNPASSSTDRNFPREKCQMSKILQGQVRWVSSSWLTFAGSLPAALPPCCPTQAAACECHPEHSFHRGPLEAATRAGSRDPPFFLFIYFNWNINSKEAVNSMLNMQVSLIMPVSPIALHNIKAQSSDISNQRKESYQ